MFFFVKKKTIKDFFLRIKKGFFVIIMVMSDSAPLVWTDIPAYSQI